MIFKIFLNFALIFLLSSCNQFNNYTEVQVGHTIKVSSNYFDEGNEGLVYAWGPPKSKSGDIPEFEIKDNHLYFTPEKEGEYSIELSVETLGGDMIIEENFNYKAVFQVNPSEKSYMESSPPSKESKNTKIVKSYFTVQLCAKIDEDEAAVEFTKLQDMGYNDIYIEEFTYNDALYFRVRAGKFNSMKKAEKRRDEIADILKIKASELWTLKVN
tara:strand:- start:71 stop:712 length:642 start_codon:yes stop_codon:yes gene_type:complete